jgi:hypothetical protein
MSLKEDTVSADRKERIIFDPEAWRKSDKSGRKTSAITSRQNFDNEKFTRNAKDKVDEGTIQPSGDSKVDSAGPTQSDTISDTKKVKKSNNAQIEFVTGNDQPVGSASTAIGSAQATGRKIAEALISKIMAEKCSDASKDVKKKTVKKEETNMSEKLTYAQFVEQLLEYTPGPGGRTVVKGRSYGASYDAGEDEDDKPAKPAADAPKRGRGRPAGSKSGANQKVTKGKSYGGIATHSLNLPNSNR